MKKCIDALTTDEIRWAVAKYIFKEEVELRSGIGCVLKGSKPGHWLKPLDYPNDIVAAWEMKEKLIDEDRIFAYALALYVEAFRLFDKREHITIRSKIPIARLTRIAHATPKERCRAALKAVVGEEVEFDWQERGNMEEEHRPKADNELKDPQGSVANLSLGEEAKKCLLCKKENLPLGIRLNFSGHRKRELCVDCFLEVFDSIIQTLRR